MAAPACPDILTLPLLRQESAAALAGSLRQRRLHAPVALVLPCHVRELGTPALDGIIRELAAHAGWLDRIVIGLDDADADSCARAAALFRVLPQRTDLLWNDSPENAAEYVRLAVRMPVALTPGKGRNVWTCLVWLQSQAHRGIVAVHDCDISSYSADMLARLCLPVGESGITFCKGYCARYTDRLHGRVERLLLQPLLTAARASLASGPAAALARHLARWRYVLAGEIAFDFQTAAYRLRLAPGWGLETAMACQAATAWPGHLAQAELSVNYEHRHHALCPGEPARGLHRMAREVTAAFFSSIGWQHRSAIAAAWPDAVQLALAESRLTSVMNGLGWHGGEEAEAAELFGRIVSTSQPGGADLLPSVAEVAGAVHFRSLTDY